MAPSNKALLFSVFKLHHMVLRAFTSDSLHKDHSCQSSWVHMECWRPQPGQSCARHVPCLLYYLSISVSISEKIESDTVWDFRLEVLTEDLTVPHWVGKTLHTSEQKPDEFTASLLKVPQLRSVPGLLSFMRTSTFTVLYLLWEAADLFQHPCQDRTEPQQ